ncbi:MAG: hypothetical protein ACD_3C00228G0004 [uncultured bacterium (gcode 4)]|uniref:Uncharacterized protein n=1 Tax=uncultured bacterium (gcode 4) TaxID=1234023 RepID=K2GAT4_9BACT|nr:MAG: hypothetical protein ACD_3C00228G0004 [uncultured bacterium (gcode 4)]
MNDLILINRARELSCHIWEQSVGQLLWWVKRGVNKWADLRLDDETDVEVKCRLYGQPVNILVEQLLKLTDNDIYALAFYRTISGLRPLWILRQASKNDDLFEHFQNSIAISKIFLFPAWHIKLFYETTHMNEVTISSSWQRHKWLSVKSATKIYDQADEIKTIFDTPILKPNSPDVRTYAVWEKVNRILNLKWYLWTSWS